MLLEFGRAGYLSKATQQPEKVRQVLDKIRTDGLSATVQRTKLLTRKTGLGDAASRERAADVGFSGTLRADEYT